MIRARIRVEVRVRVRVSVRVCFNELTFKVVLICFKII
jgi:hypothetical protein